MMERNGIHLDPALIDLIRQIASRTGLSGEELVRRAVEQYGSSNDARNAGNLPAEAATPYERASRAGLVGCVKEAPPDLSSNEGYFTDFGRG